MAKAKAKPEAETPPPAPVIHTEVTHTIALDPVDWFLAPWRQTPPQARPQPAPFDVKACVERLRKLRGGSYSYQRAWDELNLPVAMTREEAHFWFEAMTTMNFDTKPAEVATHLGRQDWDGKVDEASFKSRLRSKMQFHSAELIIPLANLLTPPEVVNLLLNNLVEDSKSPDPWQKINAQQALSDGFNRYLLPYLSTEEKEQLKPLLRTQFNPADWPVSVYGHYPPIGVYLAATVGLPEEILALVSGWPDNQFTTGYQQSIFHGPQKILFGLGDPNLINLHMRRLQLKLLNSYHIRGWLANTELRNLDLIRDSILPLGKTPQAEEMLKTFGLVHAPEAAPHMLELKLESKVQGLARQWLDEQVGNAVAGLLSVAAGRGKMAEAAIEYLRGIKRKGHVGVIEEQVQKAPPEIADKVRKVVLEHTEKVYPPFDDATTPDWLKSALAAIPAGKSKLPPWADPALLPPIPIGAHALNDAQMRALLGALQKSTLAEPQPLVKAAKEHADRQALDAFAWKMFEQWQAEGAPSKEKWAFLTVGHFGSDASVLKLTPLVRAWPGESQHQRAVTGLECLRTIGTDTALMQLNGIAQKLRFQGLKAKAQQFMKDIARDKGLTPSQLEDRIVPDLELDARGSRVFDFGPRQFKLVFGEGMKPMVRDDQGKIKADLPKPGVKDDADKAKAAVDAWKLLKKQVKEVLKTQILRLEQTMVSCRRWPVAEFESLLVKHPLMINLVRLLLWGGYDDKGKLVRTFRVTEEQEYATRDDTPCSLEGLATIGIVHPLHLTEEERSAWGEVFSDYEILPPFPQLGRRVQTLQPGEEKETSITRFNEAKIPALTMVGILEKTGWMRGPALDAGVVHEHTKYFPGMDITAILGYEDGIPMGWMEGLGDQHLDGCQFYRGEVQGGYRWGRKDTKAIPLGEVDPVVISEVLDVMTVLASKGT